MDNSERGAARVTETLREAILRLEMRPGAVLDEAEIASQLDVSRTPVREAIIQLIADGLVVRDGRKAKVAPLDFDDVPKLYDALLISSRMVHRLAAEYRTRQDLNAIEREMVIFENNLQGGDGVARSEANAAYHMAIAKAGKNRYFADFYERALLGTIRLARACFSDVVSGEYSEAYPGEDLEKHLQETARQHRHIYTSIENRDVDEADRLAILHYELTRDRLEKVLFRRSKSMNANPNLSFLSRRIGAEFVD